MESEKLAKCFHTDTIVTTKCNYDATQLCQHAAEQSAKTELTSSVMMVGHRAVRCREETRRSNTRKQKKTCACSRSAAGRRRQSANFSAHRHKLHKYDHDDNVNDNKVGTVKYQQQCTFQLINRPESGASVFCSCLQKTQNPRYHHITTVLPV